jgi:haloalkane dehalogenase
MPNRSVIRTPETNFESLPAFPFAPHYLELNTDISGLRMHYLDEGPRNAPVALLLHGMPTWSYLYRHMIPPLLAAGFRCIAPDHVGFGRSDKVTDPNWYNIERHTNNLTQLINALDLRQITLFVQDWGGPTGLAQYAAMPERFDRLVIMNTWLDHAGYEYSTGILQWIEQNQPGGLFRNNIPSRFNWGTLMALSTGRVSPKDSLFAILSGSEPVLSPEARVIQRAYDAPFAGLGESGVAGPRRFPLCIPIHDPVSGNAEQQRQHYAWVNATQLPVHFIWGVNDPVFTLSWGKQWHRLIPHSTWHEVNAGHFPQDTHGADIVAHVLSASDLAHGP